MSIRISIYLVVSVFSLSLLHCPCYALSNKNISTLCEKANIYMTREEYSHAHDIYKDLLAASDSMDTKSVIELTIRMAKAEFKLKNFDEAKNLLDNLLHLDLPEDLLVPVEALRAGLHYEQNSFGEAYYILYKLNKIVPVEAWHPDEKQFFFDVEEKLNQQYDSLLIHAKDLVDSGLYIESTSLYKEVLAAIRLGYYPAVMTYTKDTEIIADKIQYLLAEAYFLYEDYHKTIAILKDQKYQSNTAYQKSLYLQSKAYRHLGEYESAIEILTTYLNLDNENPIIYYDGARWEIGFSYYMLGDTSSAQSHFLAITPSAGDNHYYYMACVYMAHISLKEQCFSDIEKILSPLFAEIPENNPIRHEINYLLGETSFHNEDYSKAIEFYSLAIPTKNRKKAHWYPLALYNLGWSQLKLCEHSPENTIAQALLLDKAEESFCKLISLDNSPKAYLSLAKTYILRDTILKENEQQQKVEELLSGNAMLSSLDSQAEALLLRAEASTDYAFRSRLYRQLTDDIYKETTSYGEGWYCHGLNDFQKATDTERKEILDISIQSLTKAFKILRPVNKEKAGLALHYLAQAYYIIGSQESYLSAIHALNHLIEDNPVFSAIKTHDAVLYLRGLVASKILGDDDEEYLSIAKVSLNRIVDDYSEGFFADKALDLLGTIYFHRSLYDDAEKTFTTLATTYQDSGYAGDAWFWAGECADWQHKPPEIIKEYRRNVFENYPGTIHAPEAFFYYYSFSEYMNSDADALLHLKKMPQKYPSSTHSIIANYLLGLNAKTDHPNGIGVSIEKKNFKKALSFFEKAIETFDTCYANDNISSGNLEYFTLLRYRSIIEKAMTTLAMSEEAEGATRHVYLENASEIFSCIISDFEDENNPLTQLLAKGSPFPRTYEESEYGLAHVFLIMDKDSAAEKILSKMLRQYSEAKISRGYYLSRAWYEQGRIAIRKQEYDLALKFLSRAENTAKERVLSVEQKLDLWIQTSACYRALNQLDMAMLMLSKVINETAASNLRIKAMYLRAEIYELQGRHELAIKQLEATVQKGGEWASKAKGKLENDYGFL